MAASFSSTVNLYGFNNAILTCIEFATGKMIWRESQRGQGNPYLRRWPSLSAQREQHRRAGRSLTSGLQGVQAASDCRSRLAKLGAPCRLRRQVLHTQPGNARVLRHQGTISFRLILSSRVWKILSAAEMREVDRFWTHRTVRCAGLALMENAAASTVEATENKFGEVANKRALVICGRATTAKMARRSRAAFIIKNAAVDVLLLGTRRGFERRCEDELWKPRWILRQRPDSNFRFVEIGTKEPVLG